MSEPLRVDKLAFTYPDGTPVLRGIDLQLAEGERLGLVGPNGAGKSTLLLQLNGLLRGGEGTVGVDGIPVRKSTLAKVRRRVGFVFQQADDQLFLPTVAENVGFGLDRTVTADERQTRIDHALARVGLAGQGARNAWHLSPGEKRRAALACVLVLTPRLLVLDEPSAGLDPRGRRELIGLLRELELPLLLASHDLALVEALCGRVVVLDGGRVVADGPAGEILSNRDLLLRHGLA